MKILFPLIYIITGCIFLLISTIFYPAVYHYLTGLGQQPQWRGPAFWDLSTVLGIVRIIFIIVGIFLTAFGIGMLCFKKQKTN